jgi:hypothetical protein
VVEMLLGSSRQWTTINVNFSRMKVLIQNPDNLLYLESVDHWSPDIKTAFDFVNSDEAIAFCARNQIAPVQVVLQWEGLPYSISIPIIAGQQADGAKSVRARKHG